MQNPLPAGAATIANTACANLPASPPLQTAACDTVTTPTQGQPNLALTKIYTGGPVLPGALLTFALQLSNTGNQNTGPVTLQETVPTHTTFNPGASTAGWTCAAPTAGAACTLALGALAAGAVQHATFAVTADPTLPPATVIDNTACATTPAAAARTGAAARRAARTGTPASATGPDRAFATAATAGSAGAAGTIPTAGASACANAATPAELATDTTLAVAPRAVSILGGVANPSGPLRYTLLVPNTTAQTLNALVSTLTLDRHETLVPGSVATSQGTVTTGNAPGDTTAVIAIGNLPPGQTATITFDCTIDSGLPPGTTVVAAQALTTGANIPADASDDPATPEIDAPTLLQVTVAPAGPQAIPTLGPWGLLLLGAGLAAAAVTVQRRRTAAQPPETTRPFVP